MCAEGHHCFCLGGEGYIGSGGGTLAGVWIGCVLSQLSRHSTGLVLCQSSGPWRRDHINETGKLRKTALYPPPTNSLPSSGDGMHVRLWFPNTWRNTAHTSQHINTHSFLKKGCANKRKREQTNSRILRSQKHHSILPPQALDSQASKLLHAHTHARAHARTR